MNNSASELSLRLKESTGWFAAGTSFRRALRILSDGAFKLFAYLCIEADRRTGQFESSQTELAKAIGKSRRIVGKYIEELDQKQICTVLSAKNQYGRTSFKINDEYWPYQRMQTAEDKDKENDSYVDEIKKLFVNFGCTVGNFSIQDIKFAQSLQQRGIPLETVQDALLMGTVRKYVSWLNSGSSQPIATLAYFSAVISEIQERPLPVGYREYLDKKVVQLAKAWARKSPEQAPNQRCLDMPSRPIVR